MFERSPGDVVPGLLPGGGQTRGGIGGFFGKVGAGARAGLAFAGLYLIPVKASTPPASSRLEPAY